MHIINLEKTNKFLELISKMKIIKLFNKVKRKRIKKILIGNQSRFLTIFLLTNKLMTTKIIIFKKVKQNPSSTITLNSRKNFLIKIRIQQIIKIYSIHSHILRLFVNKRISNHFRVILSISQYQI